ncbi:MAG: sulfatase-like hydrolase/transferase [Chloroflexi bacterium]|nr:sulfatase-like hydrolase/transferase [Chloroflexota bacterium]
MPTTTRPNVLLITTDTQRTDTLACYGNPHAISPHLDRLAREGVVFDQAHTPSPVCMPARCGLLTGVHTPVHGCIENGVQRYEHLPLLPDLLRAAGYTNVMVGKTHFGPVPDSFDVQHVLRGEKSGDSDDFYGQHLRQHGYRRGSRHPNPIPEELFCEAFLVDTTIQEIERVVEANRGPFFAFCSMLSPHEPFDPPGRWATAYDDRPLPPLNYTPGEEESLPRHLRVLLGLDRDGKRATDNEGKPLAIRDGRPDVARIDAERRLYYGSAAYCDQQIGRLIDYLDRSGLREQTLVIFTSDHGTQLYDHGFKDKHDYYDASWRVPLILSLPGTLPQGERRDFAIWNDLTATILAAAGTGCATMQAFDLFTPLARGEASPRRCAVGTLYKSCALATPRWKLEYYFEDGLGRLFDRLLDPLERTDLYDTPTHRALRDDLVCALLTWRADLLDLHGLQARTGGGGPVATRAAAYTRAMRGTDPERRLNDYVDAIEERYWGLSADPV